MPIRDWLLHADHGMAPIWRSVTAGDDRLIGGDGNDALSGGQGADTLIGDFGNDALDGGIGNDTYQFAIGSGLDTISDYDITAGNIDIVTFSNVSSTALTALERKGNDLVVRYSVSDQLTVGYYFNTDYPGYKVEQFKFSDGVTWDEAAIKARVITNGDAGNNAINGYNDGTNRIHGLGGVDNLHGGALADTIDGGMGDDMLNGNAGGDSLVGGDGNDNISGGEGTDTLMGGLGTDVLSGGNGEDILDGGAGNDGLDGGLGNDIYQFAIGSGVDSIADYDTTAGNADIVSFSNVTSTALTSLERKGNDLLVKYGISDQLTVSYYFNTDYPGYKIEQFKFSDGVTWNEAGIKARVVTNGDANSNSIVGYNDGTNRIHGLGGNDFLYGGPLADTMDGGIGDDILNGNAGGDSLIGGDGNDKLTGGDGADTLMGGIGNDALEGGTGNDVYQFATGAGLDTITDYDTVAGNIDIVSFSDVSSMNLTSLERQGNDLIFKYGAIDQLTLSIYFNNEYPGYRVEQFKFSDGVTWDEAAIKARAVTYGDGGINTIIAYSGGTNRIHGLGGNDYLHGGALADTIDGGIGNDLLNGNAGGDSLDGGVGDDNLSGGEGADTLMGSLGTDVLAGNNGEDILDGGEGNDALDGGLGNDLYSFAIGSGLDVITEYDTTAGNLDIVSFANVASDGLSAIERKGNDLVLKYGANDQLTVSLYFNAEFPGYKIEQFKFSDGITLNSSVVEAMAQATPYQGTAQPDYKRATTASLMRGLDDADTLIGSAYQDFIYGGAGNDSLSGGKGDDIVYGEAGNDNYQVDSAGDQIIETSSADGYDQVFSLVSYTLPKYVERLELLYSADINAYGHDDGADLFGNLGNNHIKGGAGNDTLDGGDAGADTLEGGLGDDIYGIYNSGGAFTKVIESANGGHDQVWAYSSDIVLSQNVEDVLMKAEGISARFTGNSAANLLVGADGADTLRGMAGNDAVNGGLGNDTYLFDLGDGLDQLTDYDATAGNVDQLQFGAGIKSSQLWFAKAGVDLQVSVIGSTDAVTVRNWYSARGESYRIETLGAAGDHKSLSAAKVEALVNAMAGFTPPTTVAANGAPAYAASVANAVAANWQ